MAGEMNVQLVANVVADPELTVLGQKEVCKLRLAHNTRTKRGDQYENDETWWIDATVWPSFDGDQWPQNVAASLRKGDSVDVSGFLKREPWESRDGKSGIAYRLNVRTVGASLRRASGTVERNQSGGGQQAPAGFGNQQAQPSWGAPVQGGGYNGRPITDQREATQQAPQQAQQQAFGGFDGEPI